MRHLYRYKKAGPPAVAHVEILGASEVLYGGNRWNLATRAKMFEPGRQGALRLFALPEKQAAKKPAVKKPAAKKR